MLAHSHVYTCQAANVVTLMSLFIVSASEINPDTGKTNNDA